MATPRIEIEYCTQCRFVLRAAWVAQEVLLTFGADRGGCPDPRLRRAFRGAPGWRNTIFPPPGRPLSRPREIKELIRDRIAPGMAIGHGRGESP